MSILTRHGEAKPVLDEAIHGQTLDRRATSGGSR
jgi:hypothetical protein